MNMRTLLFLLSLALVTFSSPAFSLSETEQEQISSTPEWLPDSSCQSERVYIQCFKWTHEECVASLKETSEACLKHFVPEYTKPLSGSLEKWRNKVSKCVFDTSVEKMRKRKVDSQLCHNKGVQ